MNTHLTEQQLNAYIHQTLNDAQRETLDAHLTGCQTCRTRLSEMSVLQQRVRRELTAELKAVNVPLSLTFEAIAPQLKHRRSRMFRRFAMRMTTAATVTALLVVLAILARRPQPTPASTTSVLAANQVTTFATLGANTTAEGWFLAGDAPQNYETGIDQVVTHDGRSSGYISSTAFSPEDFGTLMQMFKADDYRGKRLRLSAYVKTDRVKNWAGLWMRVDGPGNEVLAFDNMQNRSIRGTTDWQPVAVILDVPQNSTGIAFGILLQGSGRVWFNNVQFEVVGQDVSTTQLKKDATPPIPQPINLSFEMGLNGWTPESTTQDYVIDVDPTVAHDGQASGYIRSQQADPAGTAALSQYVKADDYRGKRVRITEYIKFDGASTAARFVTYAFGPHNTTLQSDSQPLYSTAQWQKRDTVLYVPEDSDRIAYGVVLEGSGQVWIDDVQLEIVDSQVLLAPVGRSVEQQPTNLDFEAGSAGWWTADSNTQEYVSGVDSTIAHLGRTSGSIESLGPQPNGIGLLRQSIKADAYRGKRVRVSGYLRSTHQANGASFLTTIYDQQSQVIYANSWWSGNSADWQWFGLVFDVPANSDRLEYGLALYGPGQTWIDDVSVEIVGNDVELSALQTSPLQYFGLESTQLENSDFESTPELQSWLNNGNADYEEGIDHRVFHAGNASAYLKSKQAINTGSYETLSQFVRVNNYRGQRLRLSGYIKADQVEGWAGLWMNIASSGYQLLGMDNMQNRPITGTTDWRKYEIVLDVPESGATIGIGVLLQGKGEIWLDDVKLEVVGQDVPTTSPYQQQPLNLNFENNDQAAPIPSTTSPLAHFGNVATLTDVELPTAGSTTDDSFDLSLHWMISSTSPALTSFVHVLDAQGDQLIAQSDQPLPGSGTAIQTITLRLPTSLEPGTYTIVAGLYDSATLNRLSADTGATTITIGMIQASRSSVRFGSGVTLTEASLLTIRPTPSAALGLSLHWMISATHSTPLNAFVQVLDAQGNLVAQSDRPLPDRESPAQSFILRLPAALAAGTYQIVIGVYDTTTGSRLTTDNGETQISLTNFQVGPK